MKQTAGIFIWELCFISFITSRNQFICESPHCMILLNEDFISTSLHKYKRSTCKQLNRTLSRLFHENVLLSLPNHLWCHRAETTGVDCTSLYALCAILERATKHVNYPRSVGFLQFSMNIFLHTSTLQSSASSVLKLTTVCRIAYSP